MEANGQERQEFVYTYESFDTGGTQPIQSAGEAGFVQFVSHNYGSACMSVLAVGNGVEVDDTVKPADHVDPAQQVLVSDSSPAQRFSRAFLAAGGMMPPLLLPQTEAPEGVRYTRNTIVRMGGPPKSSIRFG